MEKYILRFKIEDFVEYKKLGSYCYGTIIEIDKGFMTDKIIYTLETKNNDYELVYDEYIIKK